MGKGQGLGATAAASELRRNCPTGWQYSGPLMVSHMSVCLCRHVINFLNHCMSTYFYVHWLELQMLCNAFWYFFLMILQKFWTITTTACGQTIFYTLFGINSLPHFGRVRQARRSWSPATCGRHLSDYRTKETWLHTIDACYSRRKEADGTFSTVRLC